MDNKTEYSTPFAVTASKLATVDLSDCVLDGRAIIGRCTKAAKAAGAAKADIDLFVRVALASSFAGLLELVARNFDVILEEECRTEIAVNTESIV